MHVEGRACQEVAGVGSRVQVQLALNQCIQPSLVKLQSEQVSREMRGVSCMVCIVHKPVWRPLRLMYGATSKPANSQPLLSGKLYRTCAARSCLAAVMQPLCASSRLSCVPPVFSSSPEGAVHSQEAPYSGQCAIMSLWMVREQGQAAEASWQSIT